MNENYFVTTKEADVNKSIQIQLQQNKFTQNRKSSGAPVHQVISRNHKQIYQGTNKSPIRHFGGDQNKNLTYQKYAVETEFQKSRSNINSKPQFRSGINLYRNSIGSSSKDFNRKEKSSQSPQGSKSQAQKPLYKKVIPISKK